MMTKQLTDKYDGDKMRERRFYRCGNALTVATFYLLIYWKYVTRGSFFNTYQNLTGRGC